MKKSRWMICVRFLAWTCACAALFGGYSTRGQIVLPYTTDFESADGFSLGSLTVTDGWETFQGDVTVVDLDAFSGTRSIELAAGSPAAVLTQTFAELVDEEIIFVDFYVRPSSSTTLNLTTQVEVESSRIAFLKVGSEGEVHALDGDGIGGGSWVDTGFTAPLNVSGQAQNWIRFTFRQDYSEKIWDPYVNGALVAHGLGFKNNTATFFSVFSLYGAGDADAYFDYFYAGAENPLFIDDDSDGLPDEWEDRELGTIAYGPTDDPGDVGRTLAESYTEEESPWPAPEVASGLRVWHRADLGVTKDGGGKVSQWLDLSGQGHHVVQLTGANQPAWEEEGMNGEPAVRFTGDGVRMKTATGVDVQAGSSDLTVIAVLAPDSVQDNWAIVLGLEQQAGFRLRQPGTTSNRYRQLWSADAAGGPEVGIPGGLQVIATVKDGTSATTYLNGVAQGTNTVSATMSTPVTSWGLGNAGGTGQNYRGLIAEVQVYNRALTTTEREDVEAALVARYGLPEDSDSDGLPDAWERRELGTLSYGPTDDPGDVGRTLAESYTEEESPWPAPEVASGLRVWHRADLGVTKDGGGKVSQWLDLSGQGHHVVQLTGANQPAWEEEGMNGEPAVRFTGDGVRMKSEPHEPTKAR